MQIVMEKECAHIHYQQVVTQKNLTLIRRYDLVISDKTPSLSILKLKLFMD